MTFSFNAALTSPLDQVRQRIGDVETDGHEVEDETINAYLTAGYSVVKAAARLCRDIAAKYAKIGDINLDHQMSQTSKIYEHYIDLAERLEAEERKATTNALNYPRVLVGGVGDGFVPDLSAPWDC